MTIKVIETSTGYIEALSIDGDTTKEDISTFVGVTKDVQTPESHDFLYFKHGKDAISVKPGQWLLKIEVSDPTYPVIINRVDSHHVFLKDAFIAIPNEEFEAIFDEGMVNEVETVEV